MSNHTNTETETRGGGHLDQLASLPARSGGIDLVRIVGVAAVVAGHVWDSDASRAWLYPWHVPVFFFLTGYLWKSGRSLRDELRNRWATLGIPYVVWLALLWPVFALWAWQDGSLTLKGLLGPVYGGAVAYRPFTTFWFISALFFVAILYRALEKTSRRMYRAAVMLSLVLGMVPVVSHLLARTPLSMGSAVTCLVFMAFGQFCRQHRDVVRSYDLLVGVALVAIGFAGVLVGMVAPLNLKSGDFGTPPLSALAACAISAGMVVCGEWAVARMALLDRLSQALAPWALFVVITHPIVLWITSDMAPSWGKFGLALVVPTIVAAAVHRTWLATWLMGGRRR